MILSSKNNRENYSRKLSEQNFFELITRKNVTIKKFQVNNSGKYIDAKISKILTRKNLHHQNTPT